MAALIVHVPHASVLIPEHAFVDYCVDTPTLTHELLRLTDWYTDELFASDFPDDCVSRAEVSRLVVDVERFVDDEQEACSQVGMGATYTKTSSGAMLRNLSVTRREQLLAQYYWPHHRRLDQMTQAMLARHGRCVILDAHSFPTQALPTQVDFGTPPEIGIGTDALHTSKELREFAETYFRRQGLSVGVDRPFSGTMVPNVAYRKDRRVQSVMIEVRRDLYMDESTAEKNSSFSAVQILLTNFRAALTEWQYFCE